MSREIEHANRQAWDKLVEKGNQWTVPATSDAIARARKGDCRIVLTPEKLVPPEWLDPLNGKRILCLAGGGGQQAPLLAAAGAAVTTLDNSPRQLEQDQLVAKRENLSIRSVLGTMDDLSAFADASFDLIVHPCSNSYATNVLPVWREAHRVLVDHGHLLSGFVNPLLYVFDEGALERGELIARHKIPYSDVDALSQAEQAKLRAAGEPLVFGHSLNHQIGGQIDAGFVITGFYEDLWKTSKLSDHIHAFIATRALKLPQHACG